MITIIAGSREITDISLVIEAVRLSGFNITTILNGTARGIDQTGELYGIINNIPVKDVPAEWYDVHGNFIKSAGYKRNEKMARQAQALIAIWNGESKGTKHMIDLAYRYNLQVFVFIYKL